MGANPKSAQGTAFAFSRPNKEALQEDLREATEQIEELRKAIEEKKGEIGKMQNSGAPVLDERLARGPRAKSGQRSRPPPQEGEAAAAAALAGENSGGQSRRRRTPSRNALTAEVDDQMMTC